MSKRFSASSAAQLMACPGSANLELAIPGWQEPVRDDAAGAKGVGSRLHDLLQELPHLTPDDLITIGTALLAFSRLHYTKRRPLCDDPREMELWLLSQYSISPEWVVWFCGLREFPPKLLVFAAKCCLKLRDIKVRLKDEEYEIHTEKNMIAEWLPSKSGTTPDVVFIGPRVLEVVDFKTGKIEVHAEGNDQGLFYLATVLDQSIYEPAEFEFHVFQPDNFGSWRAGIDELYAWMRLAVEADERIQRKELTLVPNDHCTFCPANPWSRGDKAKPYCPEMLNVLYPPVIDESEIFNL